jgi:hypothetical protein
MAVAAPLSSASLEPTKITTRIAPRRSQLFKTHDGHLPTVKQRRLSMNSLPAIVKYVRFQRVTIRRVGTLRNTVAGASR